MTLRFVPYSCEVWGRGLESFYIVCFYLQNTLEAGNKRKSPGSANARRKLPLPLDTDDDTVQCWFALAFIPFYEIRQANSVLVNVSNVC